MYQYIFLMDLTVTLLTWLDHKVKIRVWCSHLDLPISSTKLNVRKASIEKLLKWILRSKLPDSCRLLPSLGIKTESSSKLREYLHVEFLKKLLNCCYISLGSWIRCAASGLARVYSNRELSLGGSEYWCFCLVSSSSRMVTG